MASMSERISRAILGDPLEAGLLPKPISYEDLHNDVQSILIPPMYPKGINVHFLQSIKKNFALQHRCVFLPLYGHQMRRVHVLEAKASRWLTTVCSSFAAWEWNQDN